MSANNVILQKVVPALLEQAKLAQAADSLFLDLEHIKQNDAPTTEEVSVSFHGVSYSATPIDQFECTKLFTLEDDREEVSLPMEDLQKYLGADAKIQSFAVNQSKVIVLMVDRNFDKVTTPENLMKSIAAILSEMCDMETGKIEKIRLPLVLTGGFTMAAHHEGETFRIDIYNEDLIHAAAIQGLRLVF